MNSNPVIVAWLSRPAALLGILGSYVVIREVVEELKQHSTQINGNTNRRLRNHSSSGKAIPRMLLAMSIVDILFSFTWILGTLLIPSDGDNYWGNFGTTTTCTIQGFFVQFGFLASPLCNASLALYYLLIVKYNWKDSQIEQSLEKYIHAFIWTFALAMSVPPIFLKMYNPSFTSVCYLSNYPLYCHDPTLPGTSSSQTMTEADEDEELIPCVRGEGSWIFILICGFVLVFGIVSCLTIMAKIYFFVRGLENKSLKYATSLQTSGAAATTTAPSLTVRSPSNQIIMHDNKDNNNKNNNDIVDRNEHSATASGTSSSYNHDHNVVIISAEDPLSPDHTNESPHHYNINNKEDDECFETESHQSSHMNEEDHEEEYEMEQAMAEAEEADTEKNLFPNDNNSNVKQPKCNIDRSDEFQTGQQEQQRQHSSQLLSTLSSKVLSTTNRITRSSRNKQTVNREKSKQVAKQGIFYIDAFLGTFILDVISVILHIFFENSIDEMNLVKIDYAAFAIVPLQGIFNFVVYCHNRPNMKTPEGRWLRKVVSFLWCFKLCK